LMLKRLTLTGSTLRARPNAFKGALARTIEDKVWPLVVAGEISPVIDSTFPLNQIVEAHKRMDGGQHIGKIVLTVE
jgi:NADPH2:quinone reductase